MIRSKNKTCANNSGATPNYPCVDGRFRRFFFGALRVLVCFALSVVYLATGSAQSPDEAVDSLLIDYQKTDVFRRAVASGVVAIRIQVDTPQFLDTRLTPPPIWTAIAVQSGAGSVFVFPAAATVDMISVNLLLPTGENWTFSKDSVRVYEQIAVIRPAKWPDSIKPLTIAPHTAIVPGAAGIALSGVEQPGWEVLTKAHLIEPAPAENSPLWFSTIARGDGTPLFNHQKQLLAISVRPGYGNSDRAYVLVATALRTALLQQDAADPVRKERFPQIQ
ncbi:MAG: hypothetical protein HUU55_09130 [Myxococcales bacterium]|nr:hypothetical protein [Myxococcales bacterium]